MPEPKIKTYSVRVPEDVGKAMKEVARRERRYLNVVWEEALRQYIASKPGKRREGSR